MELATERSTPSDNLGDYSIWIHGGPGVGKTSLTAEFPKAHLLMAEVGGAKAIAAYQKPVRHWTEFLKYVELLSRNNTFKTFSVDVVEQLYQLCFDYMCQEVLRIEHPQDEKDYGKSWGKINFEFMRGLRMASSSGKGMILVSHSTEKPIKNFTGEEYELIRPNLGGTVCQVLHGAIDIMGYIYVEGSNHFMRIRDDGNVMAKVRPVNNFLWPDGEQIEVIPLGRSAKQAYENFIAAFNNELSRPKKVLKAKRKK